MMTGNELIAFTRELIHESSPDFWLAPNLLVNLKKAQQRLAMKMQRAAERVFYGSCTIPTVSGTRAYKLPDGTLYSAAKKCMGKVDFIQYSTETPLRKVDFLRMQDGASGTPAYFSIAGDYLYLDPTPNSVRNYTCWYPYFPTAIAANDDEIDFIDGFEPMIALEAARMSMVKDEADLSDLRLELAEYWRDFKETYCGNRIESEPDVPLTSIHEDDDL